MTDKIPIFDDIGFIESSNISKIGYDKKDKVLRVWFKGGGLYEYINVPQSLVNTMTALNKRGESIGSFFHKKIKSKYKWKKLDEG